MTVKNRELSAYISTDLIITVTNEDKDFIEKTLQTYKDDVGVAKFTEMRNRVAGRSMPLSAGTSCNKLMSCVCCCYLLSLPQTSHFHAIVFTTTIGTGAAPFVSSVRYVLKKQPAISTTSPSFSQRKGLLFTGHATNPTNLASIRWFLYEMWPKLQARLPGVTIALMGHGDATYRAMIDEFKSTNVNVVGYVDNPMDYINAARAFVSPIVVGTGINTKNVLAMSNGLPLITTHTGRQVGSTTLAPVNLHVPFSLLSNTYSFPYLSVPSLPLPFLTFLTLLYQGLCSTTEDCSPNGAKGFLVAMGLDEFVEHTVRVYNDEQLWTSMRSAAVSYVKEHFSLAALTSDVNDALQRLECHPQVGSITIVFCQSFLSSTLLPNTHLFYSFHPLIPVGACDRGVARTRVPQPYCYTGHDGSAIVHARGTHESAHHLGAERTPSRQ
jgi:hypothetical protein